MHLHVDTQHFPGNVTTSSCAVVPRCRPSINWLIQAQPDQLFLGSCQVSFVGVLCLEAHLPGVTLPIHYHRPWHTFTTAPPPASLPGKRHASHTQHNSPTHLASYTQCLCCTTWHTPRRHIFLNILATQTGPGHHDSHATTCDATTVWAAKVPKKWAVNCMKYATTHWCAARCNSQNHVLSSCNSESD